MTDHLLVRTATGSTYQVDGRTWRRTSASPRSGPLRTEDGTLLFFLVPQVGKSLTIVCAPIAAGSSARVITTSPVVEIIDLDQGAAES